MYIKKIETRNFKCFEGSFQLELNKDLNIIVGDNEAGKTTIIEAIHLALTGLFHGKYLRNELSPYLFNNRVIDAYLASLITPKPQLPPTILIELYLDYDVSPEAGLLVGNGNSSGVTCPGILYKIEYNDAYDGEYNALDKTNLKSLPIEFYRVVRKSFARKEITALSIPIKSALIDNSTYRTSSGSDLYISRIVRNGLEDEERVKLSQAHREMKQHFMDNKAVQGINDKLQKDPYLKDKNIEVSVDLGTQSAWENSLGTYLDEVPFHLIGKGEQSIIKTALAMGHKRAKDASVVLLEEPETHLSHTKMSQLISRIESNSEGRQLIVSTHSSYVANKLGLNSLILLNSDKTMRLNELKATTSKYFKKLPGYDVLRLLLCNRAILVEGDCDELMVQRAYTDLHGGRLPIEDGVEVISVRSLAFNRFLEIAAPLQKRVHVVTDSDGKIEALEKKYADYLGDKKKDCINICYDDELEIGPDNEFNYNTLEPKLLKKNGLVLFNKIFGTKHAADDEMFKYMHRNKTVCSLKLFETKENLKFPEYIMQAVKNDG
ncbi:AAA family ATPase [Pseudovibrio sp. Tun.PSC04-5.I4]|uniref:ATP-dependent nuclease n=1 Tax=Pseudovibrio sp. Tun.PSC04-5.I4 TaxID=1798213 RepID=UPI00088873F2|nr:AAA family ATPase [Pseudovibrio sp. Tun.PSC04-5.I4]SDR20299.1 putative ATP-dependent endonuclease of the OLD family [Pseudovibrio sp. Tun.PSC04-5.I4]